MSTRTHAQRERILRTLTFWLRPAFVLRVINRFQKVVGFDRAIALASSAFTALIPLAILAGTILARGDATETADRIIARYGLSGAGAEAVKDVLSPATGSNTDIGILGVFLLVVAVLSFTRGVQRLFEQTWELDPLSVRNTVNGLLWIVGFGSYIAFSWWIRSLLDGGRLEVLANVLLIPESAVFLAWSGRVLTARRISWRNLLPFAIIGSGVLALTLIAAGAYVPHLFTSYASRYGTIGAVLAMISTLFALMVVLVASAAIGREVSDELDRIGRGERPPDDEVKREWDAVIHQARSRTQTLRERIHRLRQRDRQPQ
ncbi:MAG TPA: YhjD/YihY/BrkB family envelope integrity protein [Solirubrobacteraceae bacterium]|nr:YhjD/YihY/BrkB family envelope integrity protein [Solirubrobacteraceae bacterium]